MRRAGWNVLTLHYRGSWGSPGRFSLAGAGDDVEVAMAYLAKPDNARRYGIDTRHLVIAGHSMGGFLAARYAAAHDDIAGAVLIDPWNVGASGKAVLSKPESRQDAIAAMGDDFGNSLAGTDAAQLMAEAERHASDRDLLETAIRSRGGPLQAVTLASDHAFADHRIALAGLTVNWLDGLKSYAAARTTRSKVR